MLDSHSETIDFDCGVIAPGPILDSKSPGVPGAGDDAILEITARQRSTHVRAKIVDCVVLAGVVEDCYHAAVDLVMESKFLEKLEHPNIINIRGWSCDGMSSFASGSHDGFFLILDRVDTTLSDRIEEWKMYNDQDPTSLVQFHHNDHEWFHL